MTHHVVRWVVAYAIKRRDFGGKLRQVIIPLAGAALMAYFAYHAVQGNRGLIAWWKLRYEIERTDLTLSEVESEKQTLERRVVLLRPESLDRDMLEERARVMLGYVHPLDRIVPLDVPQKPGQNAADYK
jgi:cell division protein FtsB